jgi:hypothetical protein
MADTKSPSPPNNQQDQGPNVVMRDFSGMASNMDPHDIPPGQSVHQLNVGVGPQGELRVRLGARVVQFDS